MVVREDTISSNTCNTHYCSVNDSFNPQGVGETHKKGKQTEKNNQESSNHPFCTSASCRSIVTEDEHNSKSTPIMCHQHHQQQIPTKNESNYSVTNTRVIQQLNNEVDANSKQQQEQNQHQHHPNCCLNLRESCVDSPCVSIQQPLYGNNNGNSATSTNEKDIETVNSGVIGNSATSATVVTIGLDGNTGFNVHSKKLLDERNQSFSSTELRTFKTTKSEPCNNSLNISDTKRKEPNLSADTTT